MKEKLPGTSQTPFSRRAVNQEYYPHVAKRESAKLLMLYRKSDPAAMKVCFMPSIEGL